MGGWFHPGLQNDLCLVNLEVIAGRPLGLATRQAFPLTRPLVFRDRKPLRRHETAIV